MKILIFGDIHGRFNAASAHYDAVMQTYKFDVDLFIQVGDFGFWPRDQTGFAWPRDFPHPCAFVDGNHEDHELLRLLDEENWGLEDFYKDRLAPWKETLGTWDYKPRGTIENGILYIGGARSIDAMHRRRGVDWFPEENISYADQIRTFEAVDAYGPDNIHTVISHDCPGSFNVSEACRQTGIEIIDGNRKFLEALRHYVRPQRWYFGHYHKKMEGEVEGTSWRCIDMIRHDGKNDFVYVELPDVEE